MPGSPSTHDAAAPGRARSARSAPAIASHSAARPTSGGGDWLTIAILAHAPRPG